MSRAEYDQYGHRQRDELFAGAERQPTVGERASNAYHARQQMSNQELLHEAQTTHEDTTSRLQKGVQLVEDARRMQEATNKALYDQSRQIQQTQNNMQKMKEDVRYSEKLLAFMRRCCCCACCGDPEKAKEKEWAARARYDQPIRDELPPPPPKNTAAQKAAGPVAQKYRDAAYPTVDTRGLQEAGYGAEAEAIDANTKQQDRFLDEISAGLEVLHRGALVQKAEIDRQDPQINTMLNQADELNHRVRDMNKNSQLRKYR